MGEEKDICDGLQAISSQHVNSEQALREAITRLVVSIGTIIGDQNRSLSNLALATSEVFEAQRIAQENRFKVLEAKLGLAVSKITRIEDIVCIPATHLEDKQDSLKSQALGNQEFGVVKRPSVPGASECRKRGPQPKETRDQVIERISKAKKARHARAITQHKAFLTALPCATCCQEKRKIMLRKGKINEEVFLRWTQKPGACLGYVHQDEPPPEKTPLDDFSFSDTATLPPKDYELNQMQ